MMNVMQMSLRCGSLAIALSLPAACDDGAPQNGGAVQHNSLVNASAGEPAAPARPVTEGKAPAVVLEGEGLRLIDPATSHATRLAFGADQAMVLKALSAGMSGPPDKRHDLPGQII